MTTQFGASSPTPRRSKNHKEPLNRVAAGGATVRARRITEEVLIEITKVTKPGGETEKKKTGSEAGEIGTEMDRGAIEMRKEAEGIEMGIVREGVVSDIVAIIEEETGETEKVETERAVDHGRIEEETERVVNHGRIEEETETEIGVEDEEEGAAASITTETTIITKAKSKERWNRRA
jgi:hypothetical protein